MSTEGNPRQLVRNLRGGAVFQNELCRMRRHPGQIFVVDKTGDILEDRCDVLVCPVNAMGTMGGGLASELRERYPRSASAYQTAARARMLKPGQIYPSEMHEKPGAASHARWVVFLVTMESSRGEASLAWVTAGLDALATWFNKLDRSSTEATAIAIPALGCGVGGLEWSDVLPIMIVAATSMPLAEVHIYEPHETS